MKDNILFWLLILFLISSPLSTLAQQRALFKVNRQAPTDSLVKKLTPNPEVAIDFPNLNKIPYYDNRRQKGTIRKLDKKKDLQKLLPLLQAYVGNFGIENFYKDTPMLWRLGQLYELTGEKERAKAYYRLALKHSRADIKKIQRYYDSLETGSKPLYVPLKYYYELVEYRKALKTYQPPKGVYTNMGPEINSKKEDYAPVITPDQNRLIFSSKRVRRKDINSTPNEDLFYSTNENGYWDEAKSFGKPINSIYNEGSAVMSQDGETLYFTRCECPDCHNNCDIFVAQRLKNGTWSNPKNLGAAVNSGAWDSQPSLSRNEDTLYFASDRLGGFGLSDIYLTYKLKNGRWAPAQKCRKKLYQIIF